MTINGKSYTYDEYVEFEKKISNIGKGRGQLGHKLNELINAKSVEDKIRIESELQEIASKYGVDKENLVIKSITVDEGKTLKRTRFASRGRVSRIDKRRSNINLELKVK